jgi:hypothetical protein
MPSPAAQACVLGTPQKASRVAIIANEWKLLNRNVSALHDRGHVLVFEPNPLEVLSEITDGTSNTILLTEVAGRPGQ